VILVLQIRQLLSPRMEKGTSWVLLVVAHSRYMYSGQQFARRKPSQGIKRLMQRRVFAGEELYAWKRDRTSFPSMTFQF